MRSARSPAPRQSFLSTLTDQRFRRRLGLADADRRQGHAASADRRSSTPATMASICSPASTPTSSRSTISPPPARPTRPPSTPAFLSYFGFTQNDPAAANITAAQMDNFMTTVVEPQFLGAGWQGNWSNATDERHPSAASRSTKRSQTSVSANDDGMRKLAMAAATVADLFDSQCQRHRRARRLLDPRRRPGRRGDERARRAAAPRPASSRTASRTPATASTCRSTCSSATSRRLEGVDPYEAVDARLDAASANRNFLRAYCAYPATQPC